MAYETTAELQLQLAIPETLQPFETIVVNDNFRKLEQAIIDRSRKVGEVWMFGGAALPAGSLECNGQAVSRTTYAALFAAIGTTHGVGNGSTTFNVPDLRGQVPVGFNTSDSDFNAVGKSAGAKTVTLTTAQMPSHNHTQSAHSHSMGNAGSHSHTVTPTTHRVVTTTSGRSASGGSDGSFVAGSSTASTDTQGNHSHSLGSATPNIQNTGGGGAHNNLQPYTTLRFLIAF